MRRALLCLILWPWSVQGAELWDNLGNGVEQLRKGAGQVVESARDRTKGRRDTGSEAREPTNAPARKARAKGEPSSRALRDDARLNVGVGVAPVSLPFPTQKGVQANVYASANWLIGVDYHYSTIAIKAFAFELGEIEEKYVTLQARRFVGNSFNFLMGVGQRKMETRLAANLFDLVTHNYSETASELQTRYLRLGLGNQWQWRNGAVFAVDWLTLNIPFQGEVLTSASRYANSQTSKNRIERAENVLSWYPSGTAAAISVAYTF